MIAPCATVNFPVGVPGMISHHWSSVASYWGSAAWKGLNAGAKPPLNLNRQLMDKYRNLLNHFHNWFLKKTYSPLWGLN